MFTRNATKDLFCCFVFAALFWGTLTAAAAAGPAAPQGNPIPSKTFEIEGGSIRVRGGILVSPGPKVILTRKKGHLKLEYLVAIGNRSQREVWVVVEFRLPGTSKIHTKRKKIKSGKGKWFTWKVKEEAIHWDAEYSFTVSVFADKKKKKPLGAESYSFLFDDGRREELGTAQNAVMELLRNNQIGRALVSGWPGEQAAKVAKLEPPFEWVEDYASPGVSFALTEQGRGPGRDGSTQITHELRATGFSPGEELELWMKFFADEYDKFPVTVNTEGLVVPRFPPEVMKDLLADTPITPIFTIGRWLAGQAYNLALFSQTTQKRAHAKVFPFPIQAQSPYGCHASAEILDTGGYLFSISFRGFQPGEDIQIISQYKNKRYPFPSVKATDSGGGSFDVPFTPPARGTASAIIASMSCSVTLKYNVGKDATKLQ